MFPEIWKRVVGTEYNNAPAFITGYQRKRIRNETYPGLTSGDLSDLVRGVIYMDVCHAHLGVLDRFEGNTYERKRLDCRLLDGGCVPAFVYIVKQEYAYLLEDAKWDPDHFLTHGIRQFINEYAGFRELQHKGSP